MWRATCSCMYEYSLVFLRCFDVRTARICSCMHKIIDVSSKFDFGRCSRVYMKQRRSAFYHALCAFLYFWWYYFWILFVAVIGINLSLPGLCRSRGWNHFRAWNMNISTIPGTRYAVLLQGFVLVQQYTNRSTRHALYVFVSPVYLFFAPLRRVFTRVLPVPELPWIMYHIHTHTRNFC